jgi:hypothetical protein
LSGKSKDVKSENEDIRYKNLSSNNLFKKNLGHVETISDSNNNFLSEASSSKPSILKNPYVNSKVKTLGQKRMIRSA